jgi:hypothetical protein
MGFRFNFRKIKQEIIIPRQLYSVILLVFPLIYFLIGNYFRNLLGNISLRSCDPDYIYFMNGLTMSEGVLKVGHIDNPGTPLQVLIAIIFRITWYIRSVRTPYLDDVLLHPDLYLSVVNSVITCLTTFLLYYAGKKVLLYSCSVFYALVMQTSLFLPIIWYEFMGRIIPELMMAFPVMLLSILILKVYFGNFRQMNYWYVFLFSVAAAFGLSVKLTFLPIWIIPLIIIPGWRKKAVFTGLSLLLFFIFAFPVTLQFHNFWNWTRDLFLHSGKYGGGESNIINPGEFRQNILSLIEEEKRFFYFVAVLTGAIIFYLAYYRKRAEKLISRIVLGIIAAIFLQLLMTGKQYEHRYFVPSLILMPLIVILIAEIIKKLVPWKYTFYLINLTIVVFFVWYASFNRQWLSIKTDGFSNDISRRMKTWNFAQNIENESVKIITSQNYGCPFIEYTLTYSHVWANYKKRLEYAPVLDRLYPDTYCYFTWDNSIKYWLKKFDAKSIAESNKKIYLYLENGNKESYEKTISKLKEESPTGFTADSTLLFRNNETSEAIYQINLTLTN